MSRPYRNRKAYHRAFRAANRETVREYNRERRPPRNLTVIGIDGEGITVGGKHLYTYLAAWTSEECVNVTEKPKGITPVEAFEFLFAVKRFSADSLLVGFSLGYDYTKILEGLPTRVVYLLARPEVRQGKKQPRPVRWGRYSLNYLRGRLTVTRLQPGKHSKWCKPDKEDCEGCLRGESVNLWDVWAFFQGSFIDACDKWGVVTKAEYEYLKGMKSRRSTFTKAQWGEVKDYCGVECQRLARLVTALRGAHEEAGIPLRSYYGAGSTASGVLSLHGVKAHMPQTELPAELQHAIACAFFGGRFEPSCFGPIRQPIHSLDIASAYPYQLTALPCLACGKWERVTGRDLAGRLARARWALVRYSLPYSRGVPVDRESTTSPIPWGPFPLRTEGLTSVGPLGMGIDDGNIVFPVTSGGGWVHLDEYMAGEKGWPNVKPLEAWIYDTNCAHTPFSFVSNLYVQRLLWGKEGRGIVVKLGANSIYGKIAQSIGQNPPFQCFCWAGMITSGTRAQLLDLIAQAPESVLMTATDGILSTKELRRPAPRDTGTGQAAKDAGKEPLGAWEHKRIDGGMMIIRAGIAFPLTSELEAECKARGIGKAVLRNSRAQVLASWEAHGPKAIGVTGSVFHGLKSSTRRGTSGDYERAENYGQWSERETQVSYMPEPKRPFRFSEGRKLCTWAFGPEVISAPYGRIVNSATAAMIAEKELQREQPDREDIEDEL